MSVCIYKMIIELYHSIKAPVCQWVNESIVCLFPNFSKTANPSKLDFEGWFPLKCRMFRLKNIQICQTISRKLKKIEHVQCALYDFHTPYILFYPLQILHALLNIVGKTLQCQSYGRQSHYNIYLSIRMNYPKLNIWAQFGQQFKSYDKKNAYFNLV